MVCLLGVTMACAVENMYYMIPCPRLHHHPAIIHAYVFNILPSAPGELVLCCVTDFIPHTIPSQPAFGVVCASSLDQITAVV